MNTFLTLQDISDFTSESQKEHIAHYISDTKISYKSYVLNILDNLAQKFELIKPDNSTQEYSPIDFRNVRGLSLAEIETLFLTNFKINFNNPEDIKRLNTIYQNAINIIKIRFGRTSLPELVGTHIRGSKDTQDMLDTTGKGKKGIQTCHISKIFLSLALLDKDPRIHYIEEIHDEITNYILGMFDDVKEIAQGLETGEFFIPEKGTHIPTQVLHRPKELQSMVGKQMGNINCSSVDGMDDLHGYTFEMDTQENDSIIYALQKTYFFLLKKAKEKSIDCDTLIPNIEIENKNLISFEDVEKIKNNLNPDFYNLLSMYLRISERTGRLKAEHKGTAKNYKDIKIALKFKTKNPENLDLPFLYSGTEIKITRKGNENEKGVTFHSVFDYKKRPREMTRVFGFIFHEDILFFVNEFFTTLDAKLLKKGKNRSDFFQELISDFKKEIPDCVPEDFHYIPHNEKNLKDIQLMFYKYLTSELEEVKVSKTSKASFFVHKSYFNLSPEFNKELFPVGTETKK